MKFKALAGIVGVLLACQVALADDPKVERNVGNDGIPVITIKGDKAPVVVKKKAEPVEVPERKAFRVYQLEGDPAPKTETKVVVLSSPPPIAPNNNYGWGYYPWFGPGPAPYFYGGFGNFFYNGYGFNTGSYLNYTNPPVNYQNPPVNYQNPPANYMPIPRSYYPGRCR